MGVRGAPLVVNIPAPALTGQNKNSNNFLDTVKIITPLINYLPEIDCIWFKPNGYKVFNLSIKNCSDWRKFCGEHCLKISNL